MGNDIENPESKTTEQPKENSKVNFNELPILRVFSSKEGHDHTKKRREELLKVIKVTGFTNARKGVKEYAKHYGVGERQIYKDFNWIKGNFKPGDMREVKIDLRIARDRALQGALDLLQEANNSQDKQRAINTLISVSKIYREEIEAWGDKEKIADKLQVEGTTINLVEKSIEEIKNAKHKSQTAGHQPETSGNPQSS